MVVYYKKKVYLTEYYKKLLKENQLVIFFHVSDLEFLKKFRKEIELVDSKVHLFKNNMAQKVFNAVGLDGIFFSNTLAVYTTSLNFSKVYSIIKKSDKNLILIAMKCENYILLPSDIVDLAKNDFNNKLLVLKSLDTLQNVYFNFIEYFLKLNYINLMRICQR